MNVAITVGVCGTGLVWPDLFVAIISAMLALSASISVMRQARREIASVSAK